MFVTHCNAPPTLAQTPSDDDEYPPLPGEKYVAEVTGT
jgi:hypothetical protein